MKRRMLAVIAMVGLMADLLSKLWIHTSLPTVAGGGYPYGGVGVFRNFLGVQFSLVHHTNTGAIWGLFADHPQLLLLGRLFLLGALGVYLLRYNRERRARLPLLMILVGALGNVIDLLCYGHVVDLFYFILWGWSYPVFNVADALIFCGVTWLLGQSLFTRRAPREA